MCLVNYDDTKNDRRWHSKLQQSEKRKKSRYIRDLWLIPPVDKTDTNLDPFREGSIERQLPCTDRIANSTGFRSDRIAAGDEL